MGVSLSWLAVRGRSKDDAQRALGLIGTGSHAEYPLPAYRGTELPGGWYLIEMKNFVHPFVMPETLGRLSQGCEIVGCQVGEHVMASAAFAWQDGRRLWEVAHESDEGDDHLDVEGVPPAEFAAIDARLRAEQDAQDPNKNFPVDYLFDIPVELAQACCGYRHDYSEFDWGRPVFEVLAEGKPS
jgi:hypothetical protein